MTGDEISQLSVVAVGGVVEVMRQIVAREGNGFIIELTAKPETRFYLKHPKYGDSNEVSLALEGNKEYRMNAELNYLHTIVVSSNVANADVYIDNEFKGRTGGDFTLTVDKVLPGPHKIKVQEGQLVSEKEVEVSGSNIFFRAEIVRQATKAPSVTISVFPRNATVSIGGTILPVNSDGIVKPLLLSGSYQYVVSAKDYHEERGTIVVRNDDVDKSIRLRPAFGFLTIPASGNLADAKVYIDDKFIGTTPISEYQLVSNTYGVRIVKDKYKTLEGQVVISDELTTEYAPTLAANFANVTLNVDNNCAIYVNGEYKGTSSWRGDLLSGSYTLEARKENHRTTTMKIYVVPTPNEQAYTLETPRPILGTIYITSTPGVAQVYIDKELVGETPLRHKLIIGKHSVSVRKEGFADSSEAVDIVEGKDMELNVTMSKGSKITYTASRKVFPRRKAFDAKIISHTFKNGVGVIEFDQKLREVGEEAFYKCKYLKSITIPNGVTKIGKLAFYSCYRLTSITIPKSVTEIGYDAFCYCSLRTRVDITDLSAWCKIDFSSSYANPLSYGAKLYLNGSRLTEITIPLDITEIKNYAFCGCSSLTSVTIPDSVTSIGAGAFNDCDSLTSVTIPDSVTSIGSSAFGGCDSLTSVTIPDSVTSIGAGAFNYCDSLTSVAIGNGVTSIGEWAFAGCTSLTSITIPDGVTEIGEKAFYNCYKLKSVYCKPTTPPIVGDYIFLNNSSGRRIYVPRSSENAYYRTRQWRTYNIVGCDF